jgi:uncharacterized protein
MAKKRILAAAVSAVLVSGYAAGVDAKTLSFVTGGAGGSWYSIGAGLAEVFLKEGVKASVEIGGGMSNIVAVGRGDSEIGMTNGFAIPMAQAGEHPFKAKVNNVTGLAVFMVSTVQVPVLVQSGVTSYKDLMGKKYCLLPLSASSTVAFQKVLAAYSMKEGDTKFSRGNLAYCVSQMKDRKVVGTAAATAMPVGSFSELAASLPVRFLGIDEAAYQRIRKINPAFVNAIMPAGIYKGMKSDVRTVGTQSLIIGGDTLAEDEAYKIVKSLVTNLKATRAIHSAMKGATAEKMSGIAGMKIHPGAVRYYKEIGVLK